MNTILKLFVVLSLVSSASAYTDIGDNLIEPRYYEGNLLIFNEGYVPYSIFANDDYLGTINHNQGMYVNESCSYSLYASYNEWRDLENLDIIEKKFNQWWLILVIGIVILIGLFTVIKIIRGKTL